MRACATTASSPSTDTWFPRMCTPHPSRSPSTASRRSRSDPSSCARSFETGKVSVATPSSYPWAPSAPRRRREDQAASLSGQPLADERLHPLAIGATCDRRHRLAHHEPHLLGRGGAGARDGVVDQRGERRVV